MAFTISVRDLEDADLDEIFALNQSERPHLGDLDGEKLGWYAEHADFFRVAVSEDEVLAFLIGFRPGADYQSPNYLFFAEHYEDFAYVDRIAVKKDARGFGIGGKLYADFARSLPKDVPVMTCEVNLSPPNENSMQFHEAMGFKQVATQETEEGAKKVALLVRELRLS